MLTQVSKWGNSLAIRIPRAHAEHIGLAEGSRVEIITEGETLVVKKPKYTLEELLAGITPDNLHEETDWGPPVGREVW